MPLQLYHSDGRMTYLITRCESAVVEGCSPLHHCFDVDSQPVFADALGGHDAQTHPASRLDKFDHLDLRLWSLVGS